MRKIISLLLAAVLLAGLFGCAAEPEPVSEPEPAAEETAIKLYDGFVSETLPKIYIDTRNGILPDDNSLVIQDKGKGTGGTTPVYDFIDCLVTVTDCEGWEMENVLAQVKVRGNFTSTYPKRPLRIRFAKKQSMLGLADGMKFKNWVLLAEYKDPSMLRNSSVAYMANSLFSTTGNYCTDVRFVEVYINSEYNGMYVLAEQQQVNEGRVNVPKAKDPANYDESRVTEEKLAELHNVKIGYFIEYDGYYTEEPELQRFSVKYSTLLRPNGQTFLPNSAANDPVEGEVDDEGSSAGGGGISNRETGFTIKSDVYFEEQNEFITKCVQTVWDVIYDACYGDHSDLEAHPYHTMDDDGNYVNAPGIKSAEEAVASVVDIDSLVDLYIISEICQDNDISWSSFFFSIDMSPEGDHLLRYTAPWDFDSGLGLTSGDTSDTTELFAMNSDNAWLVVWYYQDWFWLRVKDRWDEAKTAGVFAGVLDFIDNCAETYADAFAKNYELWPTLENPVEMSQNTKGYKVHAEAADQLRNWLADRFYNLDKLIDAKAEEYS